MGAQAPAGRRQPRAFICAIRPAGAAVAARRYRGARPMTPVTTLNGDVTASYGKAVTENLSRINAVTTETTVTTSSAIKLGKYRRYHTAAYTGDKFGNGPAGGYTGYVLDIIGSSGGYSVTAIAAVVTRRRHPAAIIV